MRLTREERRRNRRDDITSGIALLLVVVIFVMVGFAEAYFDREQQEEHIADTGKMSEAVATESAAMPEEDIEAWHRFNEVYREDCPLCDLEQLELFNACEEYGIDYYLMLGLIQRETQFRNIVGDGGDSFGYCQVQPRWWGDLMDELGVEDLMDPADNFRTSCAILRQLFDQYGEGELVDVLTYYNSGHGGESDYANTVIANQEHWAAQEGLHQV